MRFCLFNYLIVQRKITITYDKTCILLDGAGRHVTFIEWGDHKLMNSSSTFTSVAENLVVKGIGFKVRILIAITFGVGRVENLRSLIQRLKTLLVKLIKTHASPST